jgi:hypothetical protein
VKTMRIMWVIVGIWMGVMLIAFVVIGVSKLSGPSADGGGAARGVGVMAAHRQSRFAA